MNENDVAINALIKELAEQRNMLAARAAQFAASNAILSEKLGVAEKRIAELEKKEAPQ